MRFHLVRNVRTAKFVRYNGNSFVMMKFRYDWGCYNGIGLMVTISEKARERLVRKLANLRWTKFSLHQRWFGFKRRVLVNDIMAPRPITVLKGLAYKG